MAEVVYSEVSGEKHLQGSLFHGIKFWLAQRVPQRSRFIADANGGDVVLLDKQADVMIVDHARKEAPPGSHSYTFIEKSIRNGVLEDLEDHKVGPPPGTIRSIGSTIQPAKSGRIKYNEDDDRVLWQWVHSHAQKGGGTDGNEIYKQLEAHNGRHPWQSWRDRWIKYLKGQPRPAFVPDKAPLTPPSDHPPPRLDFERRRVCQQKKSRFTNEDAHALIDTAEDILNIDPDKVDAAWECWSAKKDAGSHRPAKDWRDFWENNVRPVYLKRRAKTLVEVEATKSGTQPGPLPAASRVKPSPPTYLSAQAKITTASSVQRSPSINPEPSRVNSRSPSLPIRSPAKVGRKPKLGVSGYRPPAVEEAPQSPPIAHGQPSPPAPGRVLESVRSAPNWTPPLAPSLSIAESPKRKRHILDDEEVPSSSPPELPLLRMTSPKRQRREKLREKPFEIASTPENSPRHPHLDLQLEEPEDDEAVVIPDEEKSKADTSEDDDLEGLDDTLMGRQPSPTLSSPSRAVPNTQPSQRHNTQAVFRDPTQFIDFDIPEPDEGWDDELDNELPPQELDPNSQLIDFPPPVIIPETQPALPDTLLDSRTQILDFSVAEPDGGWESLDPISSSPPTVPSRQSSTSPPRSSRRPSAPPARTSIHPPSSSPAVPSHRPLTPSARASNPQAPLAQLPKVASSSLRRRQATFSDWYEIHISAGYPSANIVTALKATCNDTELAESVLQYMTRKGPGRIPSNEQGVWTEDDDEDLESTDARSIEKVQRKHEEENCDLRLEFLNRWRQVDRKRAA